MKLLFENWRKYLNEGQIYPKIEQQLNKFIELGYRVDITGYGDESSGSVSMTINFFKPDPESGRDKYAIPSETEGKYWDRYGELSAAYNKSGIGPCNFAAVISGAGTEALHGWGPLLYDIAFEIAEIKGLDGLGPDSREVSDEAKAVWDYYLNNRSDIEAKQRDFIEVPQTEDPDDDCYGQHALAKRFGGFEKAYSSTRHIAPKSFGDPDEGHTIAKGYTPECVEYYFDPKNSLSKTYHKKTPGTPILDRLRSIPGMIEPTAARDLHMSYSEEEIRKWLEDNPERWPTRAVPPAKISFTRQRELDRETPGWKNLPFEEVVAKWQGAPTP
jgi:hypothetical protein